MKNNQNHPYTACTDEYISLREELIQRNNIINSQASTAIVAIISAWAAGFTTRMSIISNNAFFANNLYTKINMQFLTSLVFVIPILFFIPLSVKSGENLIQIASISTYIRVFYEYPTSSQKKRWNWESANNLLSNANIDRHYKSLIMKFFNSEYTILSMCSYLIFFYLNLLDLKGIENSQDSPNIFILYVILFIILSSISIISIIIIYRSSSIKYTLMSATKEYVDKYITIAYHRGILTKDQALDAHRKLNPQNDVFSEPPFYTGN